MVESKENFTLSYTLCFCRKNDEVLMLLRAKPPNQSLWNGAGGKIEPNESPEEAVAREVMEETGLDLARATAIHYAGIITWTSVRDATNSNKGTHVYVADFDANDIGWETKECPEGTLAWKKIGWIIKNDAKNVIENVPYLLPEFLKMGAPMRYHCNYENGILKEIVALPR